MKKLLLFLISITTTVIYCADITNNSDANTTSSEGTNTVINANERRTKIDAFDKKIKNFLDAESPKLLQESFGNLTFLDKWKLLNYLEIQISSLKNGTDHDDNNKGDGKGNIIVNIDEDMNKLSKELCQELLPNLNSLIKLMKNRLTFEEIQTFADKYFNETKYNQLILSIIVQMLEKKKPNF